MPAPPPTPPAASRPRTDPQAVAGAAEDPLAAAAAELVSGIDDGADHGTAGAAGADQGAAGAAGSLAAVSLPALLRAARVPYAIAVREALVAQGMDDVPQNGSFVIVAASRNRAVLGGLVRWLSVSKQAVGQLV